MCGCFHQPGPLLRKYGMGSLKGAREVETAIVEAILAAAGMDKNFLTSVKGNPLLLAHRFISDMIPAALTRKWKAPEQGCLPAGVSKHDQTLLSLFATPMASQDVSLIIGGTLLMDFVVESADHAGQWVSAGAQDVLLKVQKPLQNTFSSAVPHESALAVIATVSPNGVIELGAGSGYWAALLRDKGVDI
jgi:hypothetical protein